jgi:hypothetical protein
MAKKVGLVQFRFSVVFTAFTAKLHELSVKPLRVKNYKLFDSKTMGRCKFRFIKIKLSLQVGASPQVFYNLKTVLAKTPPRHHFCLLRFGGVFTAFTAKLYKLSVKPRRVKELQTI